MHLVAIVKPSTDPGADPEELARRLGVTAFDIRLALSAVPPAGILRAPSRERADAIVGVLTSAGHDAVSVDSADLVPVDRMVHLRRFVLEPTGLRADEHGPALPFDEIAALIRVAAQTSVLRTLHEKEIEPVRGRRSEVDVEYTRTEHSVEHALFLFPRSGPPWVLRAGEARYLTLGPALRPTAMENFLALVTLLRERAPGALYDDRFVTHPLARRAEARVRGEDSAEPPLGDLAVDLPVQVLAQALMRGQGGPYR